MTILKFIYKIIGIQGIQKHEKKRTDHACYRELTLMVDKRLEL